LLFLRGFVYFFFSFLKFTPTSNRLFVANLGDAEVVIGSYDGTKCRAECISEKHKPSFPEEKARIESAGGHVVFGRILGTLAVSRAFGDCDFKYPGNRGKAHFVSPIPYTKKVFLLLQKKTNS